MIQNGLYYLKEQFCFGYFAIIYSKMPFLINNIILTESDNNKFDLIIKKNKAVLNSCLEAKKVSIAINNYCNGHPIDISWDYLNFNNFTSLQKIVYKKCMQIPYGKTKTYKEIAIDVQRPRAYRFIGSCMAKNPFPIIIPCHRVIKSDGSIGNYSGGIMLKRKMLELEGKKVK